MTAPNQQVIDAWAEIEAAEAEVDAEWRRMVIHEGWGDGVARMIGGTPLATKLINLMKIKERHMDVLPEIIYNMVHQLTPIKDILQD